MAHFTIKPRESTPKSRASSSDDNDPRDELAKKLRTHLEKTHRITLEKRAGTKWELLEAAAEIDVLTPEETDAEVNDESATLDARVDELVEAIFDAADAEAGVDGPLRVRVQGWPERGRRELWTHPIIAGPEALPNELKREREEAGTMTHGVLCAVIDKLGRHYDRAVVRTQTLQDASVRNVTDVLESLGALIKSQKEIAAPMVDLERLKITERKEALESTLAFEQEKNTMSMFMEAIGLIGKAVMAERRDQRREKREAAANAGRVVDVEERAPRGDGPTSTSSSASSSPAGAGQPGSSSTSSSSSPAGGLVVHGERFEDAEELAGILEDLDDDQRAELQRILTPTEYGLALSASEARDQITYDARFDQFYDAWTSRPQAEAGQLFAQLTGLLGMSGAAVLASLIQSFEKRTGVKVAG